jgi:hypothetical protein
VVEQFLNCRTRLPQFAGENFNALSWLAGHDILKGLGIDLIPASAPDHFLEDTPTAVLVRQVLGAIAQFKKASTIAKLQAARD